VEAQRQQQQQAQLQQQQLVQQQQQQQQQLQAQVSYEATSGMTLALIDESLARADRIIFAAFARSFVRSGTSGKSAFLCELFTDSWVGPCRAFESRDYLEVFKGS